MNYFMFKLAKIFINRSVELSKSISSEKDPLIFFHPTLVCICCSFFALLLQQFLSIFLLLWFPLMFQSKRSMNEIGSLKLATENRFPLIAAFNSTDDLDCKKNRQTFSLMDIQGEEKFSPVFHPKFFLKNFPTCKVVVRFYLKYLLV